MKLKIFITALAIAISSPAYGQFRTAPTTQVALLKIQDQAAQTRSFLVSARALMVAPTVDSTVPLGVIQYLAIIIPRLDTLVATPGLPAYAKSQTDDPAYDVAAQYTAMKTALVNLRASLISTFPNTGGATPYLSYELLSAAGVKTTRTFTAGQLAQAVGLVDLAIASIQAPTP